MTNRHDTTCHSGSVHSGTHSNPFLSRAWLLPTHPASAGHPQRCCACSASAGLYPNSCHRHDLLPKNNVFCHGSRRTSVFKVVKVILFPKTTNLRPLFRPTNRPERPPLPRSIPLSGNGFRLPDARRTKKAGTMRSSLRPLRSFRHARADYLRTSVSQYAQRYVPSSPSTGRMSCGTFSELQIQRLFVQRTPSGFS